MAVQLQWGLEQTGRSTLDIGTGLIRAVTTDNVQPLAILACEQFGNTLVISPEALHKVEHCVLPTPQSAVVSFLKSTVGYSADDCASQLGRSVAGQQFLALATALVTTIGCEKSGNAIHEMLSDTATNKTLLPRARQVRELLARIEPRCHRAGLTADVHGWERMLQVSQVQLKIQEVYSSFGRRDYDMHPGSTGIKALVDAMRQLQRIGDAKISHVTITTAHCAAWTVSFVKWCIGCPPCVVLDDGTVLLGQRGSRVTVVIPKREKGFRITIHSSIETLCDLVHEPSGGNVAGMVSLRDYGDLVLQRYRLISLSEFSLEAFHGMMPYALQRVAQEMQFPEFEHEESCRNMGTFPLPQSWVIKKVYNHLFDQDVDWEHAQKLRTSFYLTGQFLAGVREKCECRLCLNSDTAPERGCAVKSQLRFFLQVLSDILALSLYSQPEQLQVSTATIFNREGLQPPTHFHKFARILGIEREYCPLERESGTASTPSILASFLSRALEIVGHDTRDLWKHGNLSLVMTSYKGQTVWPTILESFSYARRGSLSLSWAPGTLRHDGDTYQQATSNPFSRMPFADKDHWLKESSATVLGPRNLFDDLQTRWNIFSEDEILHLTLRIEGDIVVDHNPWAAMVNFASALLMDECEHDPNADLEAPDHRSAFASPVFPRDARNAKSERGEKARDGKVHVVAVDGSDRLRFIAMTSQVFKVPMVLRGRACLACGLAFCREVDASVLIL